ncbi:M6 family metalloprotease domain-containing protein, partial [Streptomyces goshikiensis]
MPQTRRRIRRPRRTRAYIGLTVLALGVTATASTGISTRSHSAAGSVAMTAESALAPCRIAGTMGVQMSEGLPTPPGYSRSTGEVRALNLMIDFPDAKGEGTAADRLAEFFPQTADWFRTSSYGRLTYRAEAPVRDWLRMPMPFAAYGIERGSAYEPGYRQLVEHIVKAA